MRTASVSDVKASLSEYLTIVKTTGEEVLVTDRGRSVAKITPLRQSELPSDIRMAQLERAGLATIRKGTLPADFLSTARPKDREGLALKALLEEREEGR
jgi:prevent-host-death family protein